MTKEEAFKIINEEQLTNYKWFENEEVANRGILKDIAAIDYSDGKWVTYIIGERDWVIDGTQLYFDSEDMAIDDFIRRVKGMKRIMEIELEIRREKREAAETHQ